MSVQNVLIVLGGKAPSEQILGWRMEEADLSIAVDSGWLAFRTAEVLPDILLGDMDSWGGEIENIPNNVHLIEEKAQDSTDFQKALSHLALYEDLNEIVILGGLGKRTDHLISNFMTASKINSEVVVIFDSEKEWIRRVTPETPLKIMGQEGATVSLVPLYPCKSVSTTGLVWEIKERDFSLEGIASQSNILKANESHISLSEGSLLVILQK